MREQSNSKERTVRIKALDQSQVAALFKAAEQRPVRDRLVLALLYNVAMRTVEICCLPADALDRKRCEIRVQGAKGGLERVYTIPRDVRRLVTAWEKERDLDAPTYFTGREGPLGRTRVWQIYRECADAAGIPKGKQTPEKRGGKDSRGFGVHALRHAAAMHALDAGADPEDLRDLLRHRDIGSTSVYANLSVNRRNGYLKKLERSPHRVKVKP